jgi:hypothetical protein
MFTNFYKDPVYLSFVVKACIKVTLKNSCGTVALMVLAWSANIRKLAKDHKGYGSAAT